MCPLHPGTRLSSSLFYDVGATQHAPSRSHGLPGTSRRSSIPDRLPYCPLPAATVSAFDMDGDSVMTVAHLFGTWPAGNPAAHRSAVMRIVFIRYVKPAEHGLLPPSVELECYYSPPLRRSSTGREAQSVKASLWV